MKLSPEQIEEAVSRLDAGKIAQYMLSVDHVWAFAGERCRVPTAGEVRDEARRLLSRLCWYNAADNVYNVGTGGLFACVVLESNGEPCGARVGFEVSSGECWWTPEVTPVSFNGNTIELLEEVGKLSSGWRVDPSGQVLDNEGRLPSQVIEGMPRLRWPTVRDAMRLISAERHSDAPGRAQLLAALGAPGGAS